MTKEEIVALEKYDFEAFKAIVEALRKPDGCPWDRSQTHESMKSCLIEECYEVIEAIDNQDVANLREELGDVMLQVVMHSQISKEQGEFTVEDVIDEVSRKLVRRHPHVFIVGQEEESATLAHGRWDDVKKKEKMSRGDDRKPLESVPKSFPAMIRANKVLKKAEKEYGYHTEINEVVDNITGNLAMIRNGDKTNAYLEQILLETVNLARILGENAENTLTNATEKFINRYEGQKD